MAKRSAAENAAKSFEKQIKDVEASNLPDALKEHWLNVFTGLHVITSRLSGFGTPESPVREGAFGAILAEGAAQRQVVDALRPVEDAPAPAAGTEAPAQAPAQTPAAGTPAQAPAPAGAPVGANSPF